MEKNEKFREQIADLAHLIGRERNLNMDDGVEKNRDSLVSRLRAGNRAAARELVDIYYGPIYQFLRRLGHSRQAGEDLTQECFLQVWFRIGQLKDGQMLNGWIYGIAANASKLYWRRNKSEKAVNISDIDLPDKHAGGSEDAAHYEQLVRLKSALGQLPRKLKQAVVLHYMQHLTIAEAAEAVSVREGTLKSRLNRALKFLKRQIGPETER
jgi:RNA polymerase sigma-70 factor (ECF subfamily)